MSRGLDNSDFSVNIGKEVKKMSDKIPIIFDETNQEVLARIIKATARKYNCNMLIDFNNGNRKVDFIGDEACKAHIAAELENIFKEEKNG